MTEKEFEIALEKIGICLSDLQKSQFFRYYELLVDWNNRINLTAITEQDQVYLKHFYDSATVSQMVDFSKQETLCDIGTGAGFPGIVLKILFPHLRVTLVDSLNKRLIFLAQVVEELKLGEVELIHSRAEEYARVTREAFDVVTARAVSNLGILIEYCIPLIKPKKYFVAMKGNISQEIIGISKGLQKIEAKQIELRKIILPKEGSKRCLILITKDFPTNLKYPRSNNEIEKKPLA